METILVQNFKFEVLLSRNIDDIKIEPVDFDDCVHNETQIESCDYKRDIELKTDNVNSVNERCDKLEIANVINTRSDIKEEISETNINITYDDYKEEKNNLPPKIINPLYISDSLSKVKYKDGVNEIKKTKYFLRIKETPSGRKGVIALNPIPEGVRFGPVFDNSGNLKSLNWLSQVNCETYSSRYNLIGYQENNTMYFRSAREIKRGEELLVRYGDELLSDLGLNLDKFYMQICTPCSLGFSAKIYFIKHKMKCPHRPKEGVAQCPFCKVKLIDTKYFEDHMRRCRKKHDKTVGDTKKLDTPREVEEGAYIIEKNFQCSICNYKSYNAFSLNKHNQTHKPDKPAKPTICDICGKQLTNYHILQRHIQLHTGEKPFQCANCDYKSIRKTALTKHILSKHLKKKRYMCNLCPLKFVDKGQLTKHMRVHSGERNHPCKICEKKFTTSYNLKIHMNIHRGLEFKCPKCVYNSHYRAILKEHMRKRHEFENSEIEAYVSRLTGDPDADEAVT